VKRSYATCGWFLSVTPKPHLGSGARRKLDLQRGLRGGAWWVLDALAANESILRWRRVQLMLGTWGEERQRTEREFRVRIEALPAVFLGAIIAGADDARSKTSGPIGVKEPAVFKISQADSGASAEGWRSSAGRVGSFQKTGSLAAASFASRRPTVCVGSVMPVEPVASLAGRHARHARAEGPAEFGQVGLFIEDLGHPFAGVAEDHLGVRRIWSDGSPPIAPARHNMRPGKFPVRRRCSS